MLTQLFSEDSRFYRFMSKLWDLIVLNILWLVTSIPVITVGASTTALYASVYLAAENKEGYLVRRFFTEFKKNFKQATAIWLILLLAGGVMTADLCIMGVLGTAVNQALGGVVVGVVTVVLAAVLLTFLYAFPMQARYENKVAQTLYKSFIFSILHFGYTFQMIGVILLPFGTSLIVGLVTGMGWSWCCLFYLLAGVSATAYWMVKGPWKRLHKKIE